MGNPERPQEEINSEEEFVVNPANGMLVSEGQEYADTARIRNLIKRANKIRNKLPSAIEGCVRLWRGNRSGEVGKNPSFTNSLEGIALPFLDQYGGFLSYVDVPSEDLKKYEAEGAPGAEFILNQELAEKAISIKEDLENKK